MDSSPGVIFEHFPCVRLVHTSGVVVFVSQVEFAYAGRKRRLLHVIVLGSGIFQQFVPSDVFPYPRNDETAVEKTNIEMLDSQHGFAEAPLEQARRGRKTFDDPALAEPASAVGGKIRSPSVGTCERVANP
ncbi:MAG: hypothetical protein IPL11_03800 [Candidatus Accumulibacter sp.]|nr:hypothetical protein [Accumulibacter sp.]